eukprot:Opistho-2@55618
MLHLHLCVGVVSIPLCPTALFFVCSSSRILRPLDILKMNVDDKRIYNLIGDKKPTYEALGLVDTTEKEGLLQKQGAKPGALKPWTKRWCSLKGSFLYYFPAQPPPRVNQENVKGVVYLRGATISKTKFGMKSLVIKIEPKVGRKPGWDVDETAVFYVAASNQQELDEWFEALNTTATTPAPSTPLPAGPPASEF